MNVVKYFISVICLISFIGCGVSLKDVQKYEKDGLYYKASEGYLSLYKKTSSKKKELKAFYSNGAARNLLYLGQYQKAYNYFKKAEVLGYEDSLFNLNLAKSSMAIGNYIEAKKYLENCHDNDSDHFELTNCIKSIGIVEADTANNGHIVVNDVSWKSSRADFAPIISKDGNSLYFTSNRGYVSKKHLSDVTGMKDNDIYIVTKDEINGWRIKADTIGGDLNSSDDEGVCSLTADELSLYYCKADSSGLISIYKSDKNRDNQWSDGKKTVIGKDSTSMQAHPSISPSGNKIAFVSDAYVGYGKSDIYISDINNGEFSEPYNIGSDINTKGKECYPNLVNDSLLYFASDGHPGYGGLDIFKAVLLPNGKWEVSNIGKPINSSFDDYSICFTGIDSKDTGIKQKGFFSSTRNDSKGCPHLYSFSIPDIRTIVEGYVMDRDNYAIEGAKVRIVGNIGNNIYAKDFVTKEDGHFQMDISGDVDYVMLVSADGYLNEYVRFRTDSISSDAVYSVDFMLFSKNKSEIIRNIYYDFDKATLRDSSVVCLDELVKIMSQNPDVKIFISSHADRVGSDAYNIELSKDRAKSVVDYLVSKGISTERLSFNGFGKTKPIVVTERISEIYNFLKIGDILSDSFINQLQNEEYKNICDQLNRRTEFIVLNDNDKENNK